MKFKDIFRKLNLEDSWDIIKSSVMWTCTLASFFSIAFSNYIKNYFWEFIIIVLILTGVIIIIRGLREIFRKSLILRIRGKEVKILSGNIFDDEENIKIVVCNEYFDKEISEECIPKSSINGQFLREVRANGEIERLNNFLEEKLKDKNIKDESLEKKVYPLGTGVLFDKYLLIAFSRFDNLNVARLDAKEYIQFLSELWVLVNKYGVSKKIRIPLIGGGPSNIEGVDFEKKQQYLLESILYTFKMSSVNTNVRLEIVLTEEDLKNIDFIKLKKMFK